MEVVRADLDSFDAVCMATTLHTLANKACAPAHYAALFERPDMLRFMRHIRARLLLPYMSPGNILLALVMCT